MAKIYTLYSLSFASLILNSLGKTPASLIDDFAYDLLNHLPDKTIYEGFKEMNYLHGGLSRQFRLDFDCPFFTNDFEFEVPVERKFLYDGDKLHEFTLIVDIKPVEKIENNEQK